MLLERAEITVRDGMAAELVGVLREKGLKLLRGIAGCLSARAGGGVESPNKVLLLVEWASMPAHEAFKAMPEYKTLNAMFGLFAVGGSVEHFMME